MKQLFVLGALVTAFATGCCHKTDEPKHIEYLPPTGWDFSWFLLVPDGNRIYKNQFGEYDTLVAEFKDTVYNTSFTKDPSYPQSYRSCETYEMRGFLQGFFKMGPNATLAILQSQGDRKGNDGKLALEIRTDPSGFKVYWIPQNDTVMTVNGVSYPDVSAITGISHGNSPGDYVTKLYWSHAKGIVKYETPDGDIWELIN